MTPAALLRALLRRTDRAGADRVEALTGLSREGWSDLARAFPDLPADLGPAAARSRRALRKRSSRALASGRWPARLEGRPPDPEPTLYLTAHIGALQALRYVLRARGVAVATVIGRLNLDRGLIPRMDARFDRRHPIDFPHALPSPAVHRLRAALKRGSLIAAADLPEGPFIAAPFLGGRIRIDTRPLRLARACRVSCRPAFLTLPGGGRWTLTLGEPLPANESAACAQFAIVLERVARRCPGDLDGVVYAALGRTEPAAGGGDSRWV